MRTTASVHRQLADGRTACGYWRSHYVTGDRHGLQLWATGKQQRLVTSHPEDVTCTKCLNEEIHNV